MTALPPPVPGVAPVPPAPAAHATPAGIPPPIVHPPRVAPAAHAPPRAHRFPHLHVHGAAPAAPAAHAAPHAPAAAPGFWNGLYGAASAVWNNQYSRAAVLVVAGGLATLGYQWYTKKPVLTPMSGPTATAVEGNIPGYKAIDTIIGKILLEERAEPLLERATQCAIALNEAYDGAQLLPYADGCRGDKPDNMVTYNEMEKYTNGLVSRVRSELLGLPEPKTPAAPRARAAPAEPVPEPAPRRPRPRIVEPRSEPVPAETPEPEYVPRPPLAEPRRGPVPMPAEPPRVEPVPAPAPAPEYVPSPPPPAPG